MRSFMMLAQLLCTSVLFAQEPTPNAKPQPDLRIGSLAVTRILFLGNSITLHAPAPDIGWTGNFGMAASSEDKDYVHLLADQISKQAGGRPQTMVRNIADFERGLSKFNIRETLKKELEFQADVIIIAIGENAAKPETEAASAEYSTSFRNLLTEFTTGAQPVIFVRSQFWPDAAKDDLMRQVTTDMKQHFVDLSGMVDESCYARSERKIEHSGVAGHPGDKGMKVIADAIMTAVQNVAGLSPQLDKQE